MKHLSPAEIQGLVIDDKVRASVEPWVIEELVRMYGYLLEGNVRIMMAGVISEINGVVCHYDVTKTTPYSCDTVACIGGHIGLAHGLTAEETHRFVWNHDSRRSPLYGLFYDFYGSYPSNAQTAEAIKLFLSGEQRPWKSVEGRA